MAVSDTETELKPAPPPGAAAISASSAAGTLTTYGRKVWAADSDPAATLNCVSTSHPTGSCARPGAAYRRPVGSCTPRTTWWVSVLLYRNGYLKCEKACHHPSRETHLERNGVELPDGVVAELPGELR